MHKAHKAHKETEPGSRANRLSLSLTESERRELDRLAAEEGARQGRTISISEFVRSRVLGGDLAQVAS